MRSLALAVLCLALAGCPDEGNPDYDFTGTWELKFDTGAQGTVDIASNADLAGNIPVYDLNYIHPLDEPVWSLTGTPGAHGLDGELLSAFWIFISATADGQGHLTGSWERPDTADSGSFTMIRTAP